MLFTNNAGSSLLHHIAQSYSDIESLEFADLVRDHFSRRKLKRYWFQEEVLHDLREERQIKEFLSSYDPFFDYFSKDKSGIAQYDQVVALFLKSEKYSLVRFPTKIEIDLFNKEDAFAAIDGKVRLNTILKNNQTGNLVNYTAWKRSLDGLNFFTYFDLQYFSSDGSKKFMNESQKGQAKSDDI